MFNLVTSASVAQRLGAPNVTLIDPRRPMKYLSGHLPGAINIPIYKAFGADGKLLDVEQLASWLGGAGLGDDTMPVLYDSPEGQNAAMMAWLLEYLGQTEVELMEAFFERWKAEGREVLYKPVEIAPRRFSAQVNSALRISLGELRKDSGCKLIDFRSAEEFSGERDMDSRPGHIPGATNLVWRELADPPRSLLKSPAQLKAIVTAAGAEPDQKIVAYCRSGPRAALGYLALKHLGYQVRLYDGSYAEWARSGLPVER